ncbi:hypothetical protein [uncultured Desulfosarcina sp.]|uniref:hypothetical protein n=1 Tax=uncultured Desulfosarcina sp. TaxID=218289 RepID=UPI0029C8E188|nr:hypothetical protein [uncultured Desulfosarcina sp.]
MGKRKVPKMTGKQDLEKSACYLADQYQAGLLPETESKGWPVVWRDLTKELRSRCPGFLELEYAIALSQGFLNAEQCEKYTETNGDESKNGIDVPKFL